MFGRNRKLLEDDPELKELYEKTMEEATPSDLKYYTVLTVNIMFFLFVLILIIFNVEIVKGIPLLIFFSLFITLLFWVRLRSKKQESKNPPEHEK